MEEQIVTKKELLAIISTAMIAFVGVMIETSMNVTFPTLSKVFNTTLSTTQWITTGYLLMVTFIIVISAYIKKRFLQRNIFIAAILFSLIGDLVCALAPSFSFLLIGRLIQAIGTGIALPLLFNVILERVPIAKRGFYMGLGGLIVSFAPAIGPTFGGIVVNFISWRAIFWIVLPIILLSLLLGIRSIDQRTEITKPKFDWLRFIVLVIMLTSITFAFNSISKLGWLNWQLGLFLIIALVCGVCFAYLSKNAKNMLINVEVFKNPIFINVFIAYLLLQFTNIGINFILPNYSQLVDHTVPMIGGLILLPGSLIAAFMSPLFGRMFDELGAKFPLLIGCGMFIVALIGFTIFSLNLIPILIMVFYIIFASGFSMSFNNSMTFGINQVEPKQEPDANAWFNMVQQFGGSIGTALASSFMMTGVGRTPELSIAVGSKNAFIMFLSLIVVSFILLINALKLSKK